MNMVVVYKTNPESVQAVLGLLRKEGFNPTTLENPSTAAVLSGAGHATYLISITVPSEEAKGAKSVLRMGQGPVVGNRTNNRKTRRTITVLDNGCCSACHYFSFYGYSLG